MQIHGDKWRVRAGPLRLTLWAVGAAILIGIFTLDLGESGSRFDRARLAAGPDAEDSDSEVTTTLPEAPPRIGPPIARFGALGRSSHLPVLSGLFMNAYALAAQGEGWIEHRIFERSSQLSGALEDGELDLAAVPLRDAVRLAAAEDGDRSIVVLAGVSLGDERVVVRPEIEGVELAGKRVGVLEAPTLDTMHFLGLDRSDSAPPQVLLKNLAQLGPALLTRELDAAIVPEPYATSAAERIGGRSESLVAKDAAETCGAVLVMRRAFLESHAALAERLVQMHEVAMYMAQQDPPTAVARTRQLLLDAGQTPPDDSVFLAAMRHQTYSSDVPRPQLESLLLLAGAPEAEAKTVLDRTIDTRLLELARQIRKEALESGGG